MDVVKEGTGKILEISKIISLAGYEFKTLLKIYVDLCIVV